MALEGTELAAPAAIEEDALLEVEQSGERQVDKGPEHSFETQVQYRGVNVPLLCLFVFLLEFKPSEPHLTLFLQEKKGLTEDQVNNEVYPVSTYTYLCTLLLSCLLCEFLGYRCLIIWGALCRLSTRALLLFSTELLWLQVAEVIFSDLGSVKRSLPSF